MRTYLSYSIACICLVTALLVPSTAHGQRVSCDLATQKAYKTANSPDVYYITAQCTKQLFRDEATFFSYFRSWTQITVVDELTLRFLPNDPERYVPPKSSVPPSTGSGTTPPSFSSPTPSTPVAGIINGSIVKSPTRGEIYIVIEGVKFHIENIETLQELNIPLSWVETIANDRIQALPTGASLNVHRGTKLMSNALPNYMLVKDANGPTIYRVEPSSKDPKYQVLRAIANESALRRLSYRMDRIPSVGIAELPSLSMIALGTKSIMRPATSDFTTNSNISYKSTAEDVIKERLSSNNDHTYLRKEQYENITYEYPRRYGVTRAFSYAGAFLGEYEVVFNRSRDMQDLLYLSVKTISSAQRTTTETQKLIDDTHVRKTGFEHASVALSMSTDTRTHTTFGYTKITNTQYSPTLYERRITFAYKNRLFTAIARHTGVWVNELEDVLYTVASTWK